jgi:hypothetical protein
MKEKEKKEKTQIEILYENYCNLHLKYFFDPIGLISMVLITNPLETPVLSGFIYFSIVVLIRLPILINEYDE